MAEPVVPRVLTTFLEAVRIDSPTGEEAEFGVWCAEKLAGLGFRVRLDETSYVSGSDTGNLIAERGGNIDGTVVVLSAHLDTVEPGRGIEPMVEDGTVRSGGRTILGADDKAGIAAILEALQRARERGVADIAPVRVIFTTAEETGLQGAKALAVEDCSGDLCLVLDAHGPVGGIVSASPTQYTFAATFEGVSAHAGVEPENGRSAIVMAANAIASMRTGRLDPETTANVGEIRGGTATNVVASSCLLRGECRSLDAGKAADVRLEMDDAMQSAANAGGGRVRILWTKEYDGLRLDTDDPRFLMVEAALHDAGVTPRLFDTGGGSDANVLASKGLYSVVLSCGMTDVHGVGESVTVADLEALTDVLVAVLQRAAVAR